MAILIASIIASDATAENPTTTAKASIHEFVLKCTNLKSSSTHAFRIRVNAENSTKASTSIVGKKGDSTKTKVTHILGLVKILPSNRLFRCNFRNQKSKR